MQKRAQITLFVIIALFVLIGAGIVLVIRNKDSVSTKNTEMPEVREFLAECIKNSAKDSIESIGKTGNYYYLPDERYGQMPFYYANGKNLVPNTRETEKQLAAAINDSLSICFLSLNMLFPEYKFEMGKTKTKAKISDNEVLLSIETATSAKKENDKIIIGSFDNLMVKTRIKQMSKVAQEIVEFQEEDKDKICISCIDEITEKQNVSINVLNEASVIVFQIMDNENTAYKLNFAFDTD